MDSSKSLLFFMMAKVLGFYWPSFFVSFCRWLPRPCWLEAGVF